MQTIVVQDAVPATNYKTFLVNVRAIQYLIQEHHKNVCSIVMANGVVLTVAHTALEIQSMIELANKNVGYAQK